MLSLALGQKLSIERILRLHASVHYGQKQEILAIFRTAAKPLKFAEIWWQLDEMFMPIPFVGH
jgi:hypothetical protein